MLPGSIYTELDAQRYSNIFLGFVLTIGLSPCLGMNCLLATYDGGTRPSAVHPS